MQMCQVCFKGQTKCFVHRGSTWLRASILLVQGSLCCGYGTDGKKTTGYDCLIIPGAQKAAAPSALIPNQAFCGVNLVTADGGKAAKTICSKWR